MYDKFTGFLSRLRADTRGNVLALTAAMVLPMIALIGGAVDMSRLYAAKTLLQSACDAGALAGRRTMGAGTWAANDGRANAQAQNVFKFNFKPSAFASQNESATYTEAAGTVTGTATVQVPMTLMRVFGMPTSTISVSCTSMMVIPNTDVMFVLDTTGSMNCEVAHAGYSCPGGDNNGAEASAAKIKGLRSAVKCFYEALARLNTDEDCGGAAPSGGLSGAVQLRFGFMPYSTNVNVGKLLPNAFFADSWTYQSRTVNSMTQWGWTAGTMSPISYGAWSNPTTPASYNNESAFGGNNDSNWSVISTSSVTLSGTNYPREKTGTAGNATNCTLNYNGNGLGNTLSGSSNTLARRTDTGEANPSDDPGTSTTPNHNGTTGDAVQTINYSKTDTRTVTAYRYRRYDPPGNTYGSGCWFETAAGTSTYNRVANGTATKPLTWTAHQKFRDYTYQPVSLDISGLKAGGSNWNASVALPLNPGADFSIYPAGSKTLTTYQAPSANATVTWDGCIEDAKDPQNLDDDPSNEWGTIPSTAYAAQIDLIPTEGNPDTLWKPALPWAVWGRTPSTNTYTPVTTTSPWSTWNEHNIGYSCPTEAKKLQAWPAASDFEDYVDSLHPEGSTYHDIGLVWGGRFASPDGIFASENKTTPTGAAIVRHMIFMTDGDTSTTADNYTSQGVAWWDRRQTKPSAAPSSSLLNATVNARFSAICEAIKNKGIILWVVSYGGSTNAATEMRLARCSSDPPTGTETPADSDRYFSATNTADLIANFKTIADKISSLRLTK